MLTVAHALLLKHADDHRSDGELARTLAACHDRLGSRVADIHVYRGMSSADVYVYFELPDEASAAAALDAALDCGRALAIAAPSVDRLRCVLDIPGASAGAVPAFHYVVETDAADGWQAEMFLWYETEHLPRLAAVPGCVRARRFLNLDRGPYSLACYDLVAPAVTASMEWLAVRGTPWSARVRPQFLNTRRTMFRLLALP